MDKILIIVMLRGLVATLALGIAVLAWLTANRLLRTVETSVPSPIDNVARGVGWLAAALGVATLTVTTLVAGVIASTSVMMITLPTAATLVGFITLVSWIIVIRALWTIPAAVSDPQVTVVETPQLVKLAVWVLTPMGASLCLIIVSAALASLMGLTIGGFSGGSGEFQSVGWLLAASCAQCLIFAGLTLVTAGELNRRPFRPEDAAWRLTLARIVRGDSIAAALVVLASLLWVGLILGGLLIVLLISSLGGRRRASQLAAFWTFTHVVDSGRPLEAELREQAQAVRGRTRSLLLRTAADLEAGESWSNSVCRRGLAPRTSWLELNSAHAGGALSTALREAAARETQRFAEQSNPSTPRVILGYVGIVSAILLLMVSYINYFIIPKFKKIFWDFGMELPALSQTWIEWTTRGDVAVLGFLAIVGGIVLAIVGEILVDYYGWQGAVERIASRFGPRARTPDLLRGLRWAILRKQPLDAALEAMAEAPVEFHIRSRLHQTAFAIREGQDPWNTLRNSRWLTQAEVELLQSAQAVGNLPWAMETLAESIVARFEYRLAWWLQVLHPAFILGMGAIVAMFALSIFLPLISLLNGLS